MTLTLASQAITPVEQKIMHGFKIIWSSCSTAVDHHRVCMIQLILLLSCIVTIPLYFYLQVKVYFQYETIGFTLCVTQRSSVECIIHEFQTKQRQNNKLGGFRCAKKTTLLSPKWGHIIFYNVSKNISICGDILSSLLTVQCGFLGQIMQ